VTRRSILIAVAILAVALAVRIIQVETTSYAARFDPGAYLSLASQIAHTGEYSTHAHGAGGTKGPSAYFPPGLPYLLAASDLISGHTAKKGKAVQPARIEQAVLGTVIVGLIGLVAFEVFGVLTALVAMALAAGYPVLVELSAMIVAESLLTALMLAALWAALRARRGVGVRRYVWVAAAGALTGLAALAHENGILLLIPLIAAVWGRQVKPFELAQRAKMASLAGGAAAPAVLIGAAIITIAPWTIRNAIDLHSFVPISDETGITLVGTYNAASAANRPVAYKWRFFAGIPGEGKRLGDTGRLTEPQLSSKLTDQALDYIGEHPGAPFAAIFHNTVRMLELEGTSAWQASAFAQSISTTNAHTGVISFYILTVLALIGAMTRAARRVPKWFWLAGILMWLSAVLVNMETPRFREPIEPFLILLAACAVSAAATWTRTRLRGRPPVPAQRGTAVAGGAGEPVEVIQRLA
jgi:4-amino-4-deoxy-L-arabinose transferase-like glycosyltransferase